MEDLDKSTYYFVTPAWSFKVKGKMGISQFWVNFMELNVHSWVPKNWKLSCKQLSDKWQYFSKSNA